MSWTALVLAGSRGGEDPVARATGAPCKAFAPLAGRPMIAFVLDALAASGAVDRVLVSIEPDAPALPDGPWTRLDAAAGPSASVLDAFDRAGPPMLVTTADHPLLTGPMIAGFRARAEATGADVAAGVARRQTVERAGPTPRRTYIRLGATEVSGCNLFALTTPAARSAVAYWSRIEALRKRPMAMARTVGLWTLARYATRTLGVSAAERALSRAMGARAALVELDDPEAAHDVDKPADLAFAEAWLRAREGAAG